MLPQPCPLPCAELGSPLFAALCGFPRSRPISLSSAPPSPLSLQDGPNRTGTTRALDCGAGIGRITKRLLLPLFKTVDMVDVTEDFLTKAKSYLGEEGRRVRNYFCCGLQDFSPEPNSYDVIWIQWVIGEGRLALRGLIACLMYPTCIRWGLRRAGAAVDMSIAAWLGRGPDP